MKIYTGLLYTLLIHFCKSVEVDFTVEVGAGKRECFYQKIQANINFEVEFQVIDGGDLDLNFVIQAPSGKVLITDIRKSESLHKINAGEDGDYVFCMDNTFSHFTEKLVFFELITDEDDEDEINAIESDYQMAEHFEMKIEDFRDRVGSIRGNLDNSISVLNVIKSVEARDRYIAERNFERVNFWSGVQLFIMVSVSLVQVLMIRGLFEDKSKARMAART